jgi:superfamily II DNA or RNA helicase
MRIQVDTHARLFDVPARLDSVITNRVTIQNPKWVEAKRMSRWTGSIEPYLSFYERVQGGLIVPRGFTRQAINLCRENGITPEIIDRRRILPEVPFRFCGTLRPFQEKAVADVLSKDFGKLESPTGSGKTVIGLAAAAGRRQPTLILVHTRELLLQWVDRIGTFLGIPKEEIGQIGGGKIHIADRITVAMVQTLYKCAQDVAPKIGFLIVDECHRTPSRTFTDAVSAFDCRYMLGLSATPYRRDGLTELIGWYLGDLTHKIDKKALIQSGDILRAEVITRETDFQTALDPTKQYPEMLSELTRDPGRNRLIAADMAREAQNGGGICLCLSDRKAHIETISALLRGYGVDAPVLTGDTPKRQREEIVSRLNEGTVRVLCATGALLGEGFDCRGLQTLFLMTPVKFDGRVLQYLGRVLRPAPGKDRAKIYDYVDPIGVLQASARARQMVYANC